MSMKLEALAREKEHLLACSTLCRMQLRRQVHGLRDSLRFRRLATAAIAAPATYRVALGLVMSWVGLARTARLIRIASRIVVYTKLASTIIGWIRGRRAPGVIRRVDPEIPDSFYGRPV